MEYLKYFLSYILFITSFAVFLYSFNNKNTLYKILCFIYAILIMPILLIGFIALKLIIIWVKSLMLFIKKI
jgi:hypothetical protein